MTGHLKNFFLTALSAFWFTGVIHAQASDLALPQGADAVAPDFGTNVLIFDPGMSMAAIQAQLDAHATRERHYEFTPHRYAFFFKPGVYSNLDVNLGYYNQVTGLGRMPDDVVINGNVHSEGQGENDNATCVFWRSCENLAVVPTNGGPMTWAVSQGTSLRRVHVRGGLNLSDAMEGAYTSGGFMADSKVDGTVDSITQQQWLSRNADWGGWTGQNWNMVFVGVTRPPAGVWPNPPFTVVTNTPLVREKPYLTLDASAHFTVMVPDLTTNSLGITWAGGPTPGTAVPLSRFYLAHPGVDNAGSINAALRAGLNLMLTPGIYQLTNRIIVTRPDTIVMGLGYATLIPVNGDPALVIADVPGVKVSDLIFDAGRIATPTLLEVGTTPHAPGNPADPVCLYDICSCVGGPSPGATTNCVTINASHVLAENFWLWRADHGNGVGWNRNPSRNGLVVNGNDVTFYGLFVEHHEQYQTLWNGNGGRVYFYQSELPYDAPSQAVWSHDGVNGYASYKVADSVTSHEAYGLGVYGVFTKSNTKCFNTYEAPAPAPAIRLHHLINVYIIGRYGSEMTHIINGTGGTLNTGVTTATVGSWGGDPAPGVRASLDSAATNLALGLPSGAWPYWQRRYEDPRQAPISSTMDSLADGGNLSVNHR